MAQLLRRAGALWRASHPEPVVAVTAATAVLAVASGRGLRRAAFATAAVLAGQLFTGWTNDLLDVELDRRAGRQDKPIATGEVPPSHAAIGMAATLPAAVILSRAAGRHGTKVHGAGLALAAIYNTRLRATPLSFIPYAGAFALLPIYALGEAPPAWALGTAALIGTAAHLGQVMPDIESDRQAGVLGLPQRLGTEASALGIAALMTAAAITLSAATRRAGTILLAAAGTALAMGAAVAGHHKQPQVAFRLTMGAAGLLVSAYALTLKTVSR